MSHIYVVGLQPEVLVIVRDDLQHVSLQFL
jgi:hypothetical protein